MRSIRTLFVVSVASLAVVSFAAVAGAQEGAPPSGPMPAAPPPGAAQPPTRSEGGARTHDGFYMRLGAGYGYMTDTNTVGSLEGKIKGAGSAWLLTLGGTPIPGLVIGGTLFTHIQPKPTVEAGGQSKSIDETLFLLGIGPTVDFYPDPKAGLHFGGGFLYSTFNAINYTSTGYGVHVEGGYDFFFSDSWSIGPLLQLAYSNTSKDQGGITSKDSATSISAMITIVDH